MTSDTACKVRFYDKDEPTSDSDHVLATSGADRGQKKEKDNHAVSYTKNTPTGLFDDSGFLASVDRMIKRGSFYI